MRLLFFLILLSSHLGYAQINAKQCLDATKQFIHNIENDNFKTAETVFLKASKNHENTLKRIREEVNSLNVKLENKIIQTESEEHFINKYVCISNEGEIFLMLKLYYPKNSETPLIGKVEIKEKHHFLNKAQLLQRKSSDIKRLIPPSDNNNK